MGQIVQNQTKPTHPQATDPPPPLCDIPSGRCFFTGPWTVTRSSLRVLHRVAAFCRPLRPVVLLVSFAEPSRWCAGAVLDVAQATDPPPRVLLRRGGSKGRVGGWGCGGTPPPAGDPELWEAPAPKKFFGLN